MSLTAVSIPRLARHVRFKFDHARNCHVLLAPERVIMPDPIAIAILECCDGNTSVGDIAEFLASRYQAQLDSVLVDCLEMLNDLANKSMIDS